MTITQPSRYRWVIVATCFFMFFLVYGLGNSTNTLYIVPVTEHFGFNRGDFSLVFTLVTAATALVQFNYGFLIRRFSIRVLLVAGAALVPLGHVINSTAASLPAFYAAAVVIGFCLGLVSITSVSILINNWFEKSQGALLGVISAASGWGGALFSVLVGGEIARNGFQAMYQTTAIALALASLPVILLIRSGPAVQAAPAPAAPVSRSAPPASLPGRNPLKTPQGLMATLVVFLFGFVINPVCVITPAYLVEKGYSAAFGANIYSGMLLVMGAAKITMGYLHDRLGIRASIWLCLCAFIPGAVILVLAESEWLIWVYMFLEGIALPVLSVIIPLYAMSVLGKENVSSYLGFWVAILHAGVGLGAPAMNYAYDLTGTYAWATAVCAVLGVATLALANASLRKQRFNHR